MNRVRDRLMAKKRECELTFVVAGVPAKEAETMAFRLLWAVYLRPLVHAFTQLNSEEKTK